MKKTFFLTLCLVAILFPKKGEEFDVKARLVLGVGANNQTFHGLGANQSNIESIGFSQNISGMIYFSELDQKLRDKLIKKAPKKLRKSLKSLGSISVGASTFSSLYSYVPDQMNYTTTDDFDLLFLNWKYISLGLGVFGFDLSLSSIYYYDKNMNEAAQTQFRPSAGLSLGLSDLSISKKFPLSFDVHYNVRHLMFAMKFYDDIKFSKITTEPSITLNIKVPFEVSVPSNKL